MLEAYQTSITTLLIDNKGVAENGGFSTIA
jgi:hypothetical protein